MSVRPVSRADSRVAQAALPLGHADVRWDALPPAVQGDVLARWCEMLRDVMPREVMPRATDGGAAAEETPA